MEVLEEYEPLTLLVVKKIDFWAWDHGWDLIRGHCEFTKSTEQSRTSLLIKCLYNDMYFIRPIKYI